MREKQVRVITLQWVLPLMVLFITVLVMLINFSISSRVSAREQVERNLINTTEVYGMQVNTILTTTMGSQKIISDIIADIDIGNERYDSMIQDIVNTIVDSGGYDLAIYYQLDKEAFISRKGKGSISNVSYFDEIKGNQPTYFYVDDDEFTGQPALVSLYPVIDVDVIGYLLVYYNPERLNDLVKRIEFDVNTFYLLVDSEGKVMGRFGTASNTTMVDEDNFWDALRNHVQPGMTMEMTKMRMKNRATGVIYIKVNTEERGIVFASAGVEDWQWVIGINESHIKNQEDQIMRNTSNILIRLAVVVLVFLALIVVLNVVTKLQANERSKKLENKAETDLLTELLNKVSTEKKIKEYIRDNPNTQSLMFVLDIDNFKKINDTMGHAFGDEVLRTLGHRIRAEFRITDILGRFGGDEFVIFMKDIKDDATIEKEGKRVENFFRHFKAGEYVQYAATASIGGAVFPRDAADFESLYKAADRALYVAKKRGKNQLAFFDKNTYE